MKFYMYIKYDTNHLMTKREITKVALNSYVSLYEHYIIIYYSGNDKNVYKRIITYQ